MCHIVADVMRRSHSVVCGGAVTLPAAQNTRCPMGARVTGLSGQNLLAPHPLVTPEGLASAAAESATDH